MQTQFDPLERPTVKNLEFPKSNMVAAAILKNQKSAISPNGSTDLRQIWYDDAYDSMAMC